MSLKTLSAGTPLGHVVSAGWWKVKDGLRRTVTPLTPAEYRGRRDDRAMRAVMTAILQPDSVCLDIGANHGDVLKRMVQMAPQGTHYAFEPLPDLYARLLGAFPSVHVLPYAMSDHQGTELFHHPLAVSGWSGLQRQHYPVPTEVQTFPVTVTRVDDVIPKDLKVRFIKIDVEGAELHVLRGAIGTIRRCRPYVVFEFGAQHADLFGTTAEATYDYVTGPCGLVLRSLLDYVPALSRSGFIRLVTEFTDDRASQGNFLASPR